MKIEIKHLAPYLPYELNLTNCSHPMNGRMCELLSRHHYNTIRPILRPLSDYTTVNSTAMEDLNTDIDIEFEIQDFANQKKSLHSLSYGAYEELIRNKVDVFGLIPAGLAIDINTLKS